MGTLSVTRGSLWQRVFKKWKRHEEEKIDNPQ